MKSLYCHLLIFPALLFPALADDDKTWTLDSNVDWIGASGSATGIMIADGFLVPTEEKAQFESTWIRSDNPRKAASLTLTQSPAWDVWEPCENIGPEGAKDAPIFLPVADGDYWYFGEKGDLGKGYQAWHSTDLKTWTHKGTANPLKWATTAEYADGKIYLYYDKPNDQDPHLVIGHIQDGEVTWEQKGMAFDDPSHGSDAGILRDEDGRFHLIYEDWSPINAQKHSWDSPLAGHADSPDGFTGFEYGDNPPAIDHRTTPTGEKGTYKHGFTSKEPLEYEIHEPEQDAYGDFTNIKVGKRYYLFCDYDAAGEKIRIGYFHRDSLKTPYEFGGAFGNGHPDPSIGFAEGKFYLCIQRAQNDWSSPGPWVDGVQVRVGADTDGDDKADQWTEWQSVRETYAKKPGFARIVDVTPASLDLSALPAATGFKFEVKTNAVQAGEKSVQPILDSAVMTFE